MLQLIIGQREVVSTKGEVQRFQIVLSEEDAAPHVITWQREVISTKGELNAFKLSLQSEMQYRK